MTIIININFMLIEARIYDFILISTINFTLEMNTIIRWNILELIKIALGDKTLLNVTIFKV